MMMAEKGGLLSEELPNQLQIKIRQYAAFVKYEKMCYASGKKTDTAHLNMKGLFRKKDHKFPPKKKKKNVRRAVASYADNTLRLHQHEFMMKISCTQTNTVYK